MSAAASRRVVLLHKPRGVLVSTVSEGGAPAVFTLLPEPLRSWFAVGRLDKDSEGALLLCADSRLAQRLMDPGGVAKTYLVTVRGLPAEADLAPMRLGGLVVDGRPLAPVAVRRLGKAPRGGTRLEVVLHEGRNRQIRRLFAASGFKVRRLVRVAVGPVALGDLPSGTWRELAGNEVEELLGHLRSWRGQSGGDGGKCNDGPASSAGCADRHQWHRTPRARSARRCGRHGTPARLRASPEDPSLKEAPA